MTLQPVLIAPFKTGLDTDVEPWLAPPDSFRILDNVHVHHGYIEKRSGFRIFAQMQTTEAGLSISAITNAADGEVTTAAPHGLATGDKVYISGATGMTEVNNNIYTITVNGASTFLLGIDTSAFGVYAGSGLAALISPASDRVMGIWRYIQADNSKTTLAFNTTRANKYDGVTNSFLPLDAAPIMSGSVYDYIWAVNWQSTDIVNRLYFTNGKAFDGSSLDGIRYYDASGTGNTTTSFRPDLNPGSTRILWGGKLLFTIKQRLVVLNTYERDTGAGSTTNYPQRARWCQAQGPSNWDDITPGGGGFIDAPTGDQIISAQALQDVIIVMFTNSVWTLRPVSDPVLPFRWDKINNFRACDGKMASTSYDRYTPALGVRGITATDGVETRRIDQRIEKFTVDEINVDEFQKVFCARSFANLRWWTLYPRNDSQENNAALIYDDESSAFSTYSIDMNCLGYGNFGEDFSLNDFIAANNLDFSLNEMGEDTLQDYFWQDNQETFLGGNIVGTVLVLETDGDDNGDDIDCDLWSSGWNPYQSEGKECQMSYVDFYVDTDLNTTAVIEFYKDDDTAPYGSQQIDFLPNLNFIASVNNVSLTNPVNINAPQHGLESGATIFIYNVVGTVEVNGGPYLITVVDENNFTLDGVDGSGFSPFFSSGGVYLRQFYKTKTWKRAFAGGIGYVHRIRILAGGVDRPFRFHAFKPYFKPRGRRTIN
jgi:hypothetical protein